MAIRVGQIIEGYEIVSELGRGGNGVVFKAQSRRNQFVAIKVPWMKRFRKSGVRLENFVRETSAIERLDHPNIARHISIGIHRDEDMQEIPYFIMELVEGVPASELRRTSIRRIVEVIQKVCEAIAYAHSHRVIHCDLKPTNILVDKCGNPKILDFGLARLLDRVGSSSGTFEGTPCYAAPEQFQGKADERTDVWSLGAIFFDLLTGHPPFKGENWEQLSEMQRLFSSQEMAINKPTPRPSKLNQEVDAQLDTICMKALKKYPAKRYQTAEEIAAALKQWKRNERDRWIHRAQRKFFPTSLLPNHLRQKMLQKSYHCIEIALSYDIATTPLKETLLKILQFDNISNVTIAEMSLPKDMDLSQWREFRRHLEIFCQIENPYVLPLFKVVEGVSEAEPIPDHLLLIYANPQGKRLEEMMGTIACETTMVEVANAIVSISLQVRESGISIAIPTIAQIFLDPLQIMLPSMPLSQGQGINAMSLASLLYQAFNGQKFDGNFCRDKIPPRVQDALENVLLRTGTIDTLEQFMAGLDYTQQAHQILDSGVLDRPFNLPPGEYHLRHTLHIEKNGHLKLQGTTFLRIDPEVSIECHGQISAIGHWDAENESGDICFFPSDSERGWRGIHFCEDIPGDKPQYLAGCIWKGARGTGEIDGRQCGGAIYVQGGLIKISGARFQENTVEGDGGALYLTSDIAGSLKTEIEQAVFIGNSSKGHGGAMLISGCGEHRVHKCRFEGNSSIDNSGGAVALVGQSAANVNESVFIQCIFESNRCKMHGGAMLASIYTKSAVENCTFKNNRADDSGGAVELVGAEDGSPVAATFQNVTFVENSCGAGGGGIHAARYVRFTLDGCNFEHNQCDTDGGALQMEGAENNVCAEAKCINSQFVANCAKYSGGAIALDFVTRLKLESCNFSSNRAEQKNGGVIRVTGNRDAENPSELSLCEVSCSDNFCNMDGGVLYADGCALLLAQNTKLQRNTAGNNGGVMSLVGEDARCSIKTNLRQVSLDENTCGMDGGAISASHHNQLVLDECQFNGNSAGGNCGAIAIIGALDGPAAKAKLRNVSFVANHCKVDGGAIAAGIHAQMIFQGCDFRENWSQNSCGAIGFSGYDQNTLSEATFRDVNFFENHCELDGGAIVLGKYSRGKFEHCTWCENYAVNKTGGAILLLGRVEWCTSGEFYDCAFVRNCCCVDGGAINANIYSKTNFARCRFEGNRAREKNGGAVVLLGKDEHCYTKATFHDVDFVKNQCQISGGAINANDYTRSFFNDCTFEENRALTKNGGALLVLGEDGKYPSEARFERVVFNKNYCGGSGGAVNANVFTITLFQDCRFDANVADENGGGICIRGLRRLPNKAAVKKCHFLGNIAGLIGADVALKAVKGVSEESLIQENTIEILTPDFQAEEKDEES